MKKKQLEEITICLKNRLCEKEIEIDILKKESSRKTKQIIDLNIELANKQALIEALKKGI